MGIEAAARISSAETGCRRSIGFLPTTLAGGFGAVIACARLMNLDADRCVNALGINYAQCAGNRQALLDQTLTKRLQPAFAARSAVWAAVLGARGVTGPANAFEGSAGYFNLYMDGTVPDEELFRADMDRPAVECVSIKRYPSCGACHHVQTAAENLRREESLKPGDIERVELFGCGPGGLVGNPFYLGDTPQVNVQFSAAWGAAHGLLRGEAHIRNYTDQSIRADSEVIELARNITYTDIPEQIPQSEEFPSDYPRGHGRPQGIIVHTKDGRKLIKHQYPHDTFPPGGMDLDHTIHKFMECAEFSGFCTKQNAERIVEAVLNLHEKPDSRSLISIVS
jgi:2-methylcitrate dehydratase PrpD